ncbi:MAG: hypothetical protein NTV94_17840, partial [Planctomycetota bacterium]|nr:hypothetical protein [Planctomycetota bacterium]
MKHRRKSHGQIMTALTACAGIAASVFARQPSPASSAPSATPGSGTIVPPPDQAPAQTPAATPVPAAAPAQPAAPAPAPAPVPAVSGEIHFNFKDALIDQVLDSFTREANLPIIYEAPVPQGTITFISPTGYSFADAKSILNLNLARFGVHLRRQDQYLYLASIQDAMKKPLLVTDATGVNQLKPDEIVTVNLPLDNARAELVAEQIKPMLGPYGGVIAVPAQNMVVVVEAAAQVRRIRDVVNAIDAVRPVDSAFKIFPLKHAQSEAVLAALRGLVGERITTVIVDKDGQKRTLQEQQVNGLQLASDPRTNSIIAVGTAARIKTVEELLTLLDTPESGSVDQQMQTFALAAAAPDAAAVQVNALFAATDPRKKPTVIPLPEVNKLTIVGNAAALAQAAALLAQIDPGVTSPQGTTGVKLERRAAVIPLRFATAQSIEAIATKLLPPRMNQAIKIVAGPDGKSVIVAGPDAEVTNLDKTVAALDVQNAADQEVRIMQLPGADAAAALAKAQDLYSKAGKAELSPVKASLDAASGAITLIAPRAALKEFETMLTSVQASLAGAIETRSFTLSRSQPSLLAAKLSRLLAVMMPAVADIAQPQFDAVDELNMLVVRARSQQIGVIAGLIEKLDGRDGTLRELRVLPIANEKALAVKDRAMGIYQAQIERLGVNDPVTVTVDEGSNALMLVAGRSELERFTKVVEELQKQSGPSREVRLFEIKLSKADEIVAFLRDMAKSSQTLSVKGGTEPVFETIEATNSVMVAAQPGQFAIIESLIKSLDNRQAADRPPVRILKLRPTDAANLAVVLQKECDKRPIEQRGKSPVSIEADPGTNTLIVSATEDALTEIEAVVTKLNETEAAGAEGREIRIFPLKVARAEDLAQTIDQMFPEPPVPLDPRTRQPRPDLKPAREVVVRGDRATNSLIVDAPSKRLAGFEQIVKSLDQAKVSTEVVFRTYKLERADINGLAATIRNLATSGSLANIGKAATAPVTVSVDTATRMLIVSGHTDVFGPVEELIKKVDALPDVSPTELKMYPLSRARSERLATVVQRLLASRVREMRAASGKTSPDDDRLVEVSSDMASNTLIVSAPREALAIADGIIKSLDADSVATATEMRVFRLGKGKAETAALTIRQTIKAQAAPGEPEATITPEPASNTITVVGTTEQIERAEKLIESLDVAVDTEGMGVKTISLKHARAEAIAPVMQQVLERESGLDKLPEWARMQALARGAVEQPRIRVASEPRINAIVVSGPRSVLDVAAEIAQQLDVDSEATDPAAKRMVRVITVQNSDATQLAANLTAVFAEEKATQTPPTIRVDAQSNALIVRGTVEQMAVVEQLTSTLDKAAGVSSRQMRTINVDKSKVDAELLARMLERLMQQQGTSKVEVISAEELLKRQNTPKKTSSLYIIPLHDVVGTQRGASALFDAKDLRQDHGTGPIWQSFIASALIGVSAAGAAPELIGPPEPATAPAAAAEDEPEITIAVDKASNSIVVVGSPRQTDRVAALAEQLAGQIPSQPGQVRVITLPPSSDVAALAQVVNSTINQIGSTAQGRRSGFTGPVSVTADLAGSALIVFANDIDFETIGGVIASVSQLDNPTKTTIKVYPLVNVNAA